MDRTNSKNMSQVLEPRVVNAKKGAACWALNPTLPIERHNAPHWPWPARVTATINHVLAIPGGGVWRLDKLTTVVVHPVTTQLRVLRGRPTRVQNDTNLAARRSATHAARKRVPGALHPWDGAVAMKIVFLVAVFHDRLCIEVDRVQADRTQVLFSLPF